MERGYELIRKIAGGGMGEVFVARRTGAGDFEKRVALKLLLPHLASSPRLVQDFHAEARLAARMHHPNIVEIFDVGEADGRPFIAMQLVDGVTLSRLMREVHKRGDRLPLHLARLIGTGLCEALTYAHALTDGQGKPLRVVHRDVTPGNVLVSRNGAVLLTDFGIARVRDGSLTDPGVLRGKAAYLAPEQVLNDAPTDARADIYSAALTLFEAITGTHPFKRESMNDALVAVIKGEVPRVETLRSDITPGFAAGLHRGLARKPEDRFAVAKELREALADGPVATAPELAEYVMRYCADSLEQPLQPEEPTGQGTRSVVMVTPTQLQLPAEIGVPAAQRRSPVVFGVPVLVLLLGVGGWFALRAPEPVVVAPEVKVPEVIAAVEVEAPPAPEPEPVVRAIATPTPSPPPPKRVVKRVPAPPSAMRVGYLTADASPWAEVLLSGRVIDRTPFVRYPLPAGKHTLVFRGPGGAVQERAVSVSAGKITAVRVDF
ncbi:MAG: serine/threonine-protein kinase [Archangium sp.]|nr:serine/threonine-protein kinase [Archangium sp.]MDP3574408.1 serine/threonine-protein kinase [Archangium sp.]